MKTPLRILLSLSAALILLYALAIWGDVSGADVLETLRRIPPRTWALALGVHCCIYVARSLRFRLLLPGGERPPLAAVLAVSAAHNLAAYVLPARSGEATFVLYLKGSSGVSMGAGLASLVVSRLLDLATLAGALGVATLWLSRGEHWDAEPVKGLVAGASLLALAGMLFYASFAGDRCVGLLQGVVRALGFGKLRLGARLLERGEQLGATLTSVRHSGGIPRAVLLSSVIWFGVFLFYAILARGFGLPAEIGLVEASFGSGIAVLTNILPINSLAGFGTQEAGWIFGFGLLGIEGDVALSTGIGVHLVQLANVCGLGLLGHLGMALLPNRAAGPDQSE